jgi:hypothetical protein
MHDEAAGKMDELLTPIDISDELKKMGEYSPLYTTLPMKIG